jgi:Zn-dependent peptidase ImmA (M78 family)
MPGKDTNIGAKRARQARERLGLDAAAPIGCVVTVVEQSAGLPIAVGALPERIAGALFRNGMGSIAWVNGTQSVERQRFTVAHEYGHVFCEHEGRRKVDTPAIISGATHDPQEVQANAFAAQFLAPGAGVEAMVDGRPTLEDVVRIAAHFGVSTLAALYRLSTLELANNRRIEALRREIDGGLAGEVWEYLDPERVADALSVRDGEPRLPPGSTLDGLVRGETSLGAAAGKTGCPADALDRAAAALCR